MNSASRTVYSLYIFIIGTALVTSLAVLFIYETYQENSSSATAYEASTITRSMEIIGTSLQAREMAFHRFFITMDTSELVFESQENILNSFVEIDSLNAGDSMLESSIDSVQQMYTHLAVMHDSILFRARQPGYQRSAAFLKDIKAESATTDSMFSLISSIKSKIFKISKAQQLDAQKHTILSTLLGVAVSIFSIVVFIIAFYFINQELRRSQNYVKETAELNNRIAEINNEVEKANLNLKELNVELEGKNLELERYAKELSSFTHITSHDIQEPLRKIEFFISAIEARELDGLSDGGKKYFSKIQQSVTRMRKLYYGMLDFSLITIADNKIDVVDLNEVLHQALTTLKVQIQNTGTAVEHGTLPSVKGIKYQLIQLFENIIGNAIRFRKEDSNLIISISLQTICDEEIQEPGLQQGICFHKIDFTDNGIGFEPQYRESIFEIFQRLNPDGAEGIGIGLAICRRIAHIHGGKLIASSQSGKGSIFSLYLPSL